MRIVTAGLPAYFISHLCYGAFETIYPGMLDLPVDNFDMEFSNSGLDMLDLFRKHRYTKDISFGVVDVHTHVVEQDSVVEERLRRGPPVLPQKAAWGSPHFVPRTRTLDVD